MEPSAIGATLLVTGAVIGALALLYKTFGSRDHQEKK